MKINSTLFVVVVIMLVAAVSYYIGGSMQETNSIRQSIHTPITETEPFQKGVKELRQGNWSAALTCFQKAIEKNPQDADAHSNLGVAYGKLGRWQESLEASKQAIRINPDYAEAHLNLGVAYGELGRYQDAMESYKQAIGIKPDYADAHYNLGIAYDKLGRYQDAIESYKQAIRINPDFADAHSNLGVAYGKLGRYQDAIESFKQAIRINTDYAEAHLNLGFAYDNLGRYQDAMESYKQAVRINPDFADAIEAKTEPCIPNYQSKTNNQGVLTGADVKPPAPGYLTGPGYIIGSDGKIIVEKSTFYPSTTNGKLDPFSKEVPTYNPPAAPATQKPETYSPYSVVDQQLNTLRDRFEQQYKRLRDQELPVQRHNQILAGMQADYDSQKYKIMDLRNQLDGIQKSITDGSVDPDLGKEAMWRLVLPPEHAAAMFPKQEPNQEKGRFGSEHTRSKGR